MLSHCPVCGHATLKPVLTGNSLYMVVNQGEKPLQQVCAYSCETNGHIVMLPAGTPVEPAVAPLETNHGILNSWKEIAAYTGRGVRTVQRWEGHFGFPVHRPKGSERSSVLAFREELDAWLRKTPLRAKPVLKSAA